MQNLLNKIIDWIRNYPVFVLLALLVSGIAWIDDAVQGYGRLMVFVTDWRASQELVRPFPVKLNEGLLKTWTSGQLHLANYRIMAYLGELKDRRDWLTDCLTNRAAFPDSYKSQLNRIKQKDPSQIDKTNRELIREQLNYLEAEAIEENELLPINDIYRRLLARSSKQLLFQYQDKEIEVLHPGEQYFLRNEIYAQNGWNFATPKLKKYFARREWYKPREDFELSDMSAVEICNAFYLSERYPRKEVGAMGRGVHIYAHDNISFDTLRSNNCACLRREHVECYGRNGISGEEYFSRYVDVIIELDIGDATRIISTVPAGSGQASIGEATDERLHEGMMVFSDSIARSLNSVGLRVEGESKIIGNSTIKLSLTFERNAGKELLSNSTLRAKVAEALCASTVSFLEEYGAHIPNVSQDAQVAANAVVEDRPGENTGLKIIPKLVTMDEKRKRFSLEYIKQHYGLEYEEPRIDPKVIVIHWTAIDNLDASYNAMKESKLPSHRSELTHASRLNVGAHYLVDRDGTVYRLFPDTMFARHVIGLNLNAIGIENVGGTPISPLTDSQLRSNAQLVRMLTRKHEINWLIGHHEYGRFKNTSLWRERDPNYFTKKIDPGDEFMAKLRERVKHLALSSAP